MPPDDPSVRKSLERVTRPHRADPRDRRPPPFINLCGDYRFLRGGYWALVDAELNGVSSRPTPLEAATAQNAAACLLAVKQAGIPTVPWKVARRPEDVVPPCLLVPVAGLTDRTFEVQKERSAESQWRRATQNGTRAVLAVDLSPGPLRSLKMFLGTTAHDNYQLAWDLWVALGLPLATVWFVEAGDPDGDEGSRPLFLGVDPLPLHELTERELRLLEEVSTRPMSPS